MKQRSSLRRASQGYIVHLRRIYAVSSRQGRQLWRIHFATLREDVVDLPLGPDRFDEDDTVDTVSVCVHLGEDETVGQESEVGSGGDEDATEGSRAAYMRFVREHIDDRLE